MEAGFDIYIKYSDPDKQAMFQHKMAMRNLHIPQSQFRHRGISFAFTNNKIITFLLY